MKHRVLVIHSGARHNYALPSAFEAGGMLKAFYTDMCADKGIGRLALIASMLPLPASLRAIAKRLSQRKVPIEVLQKTRTTDAESFRFEIEKSRIRDIGDCATARARSAVRRGRIMSNWGLGDATHVFNVIGEGGELLHKARNQGLPIFADIIIALSTNRIEREEYQAFPDWGPEPANLDLRKNSDFDPTEHLLNTTDVFVCPSQFVVDDLVEHWGVDRERTRIVPYPLTPKWFDLKARTEPRRVLFVGTADRRKGIHYLAKAARLLRDRGRNYEFVIAGGVQDSVKNHPEAGDLTFLGRVPRDEIAQEFAKADVFVLPSLAEGSATVVYEAMAAGLPVVTTHSSGSFVRSGVDGLIVPERDPESLALALEEIIEDRNKRNAFSQAGRERAKEFTWDTYANGIREIVTNYRAATQFEKVN